uniref:FHA domain-containing protein n=1 Tax=Trichocoleus desertorum TaxID=1481672 RepID=UPI0025B575AE|nr:FHA domain-containing protein [Trichocoleus desertorum]
MYEITLAWTEGEQAETKTLHPWQATKQSGAIRIGRDPDRCDWVLAHPTVSGLHVEIIFQPQQHQFYLRNLRAQNPPFVDGSRLEQGEVVLQVGRKIRLGELELYVTAIAPIKTTVLLSPQLLSPQLPSLIPTFSGPLVPTAPPALSTYGLQCPKCHQTSPYEHLQSGCPWCGTSLAAAASVILSPR